MGEIKVTKKDTHDGWEFTVNVVEVTGQATHKVTVPRSYFARLVRDKKCTPEELVKKSFEFLLEREPKESILSQFEISVISHYFPEYEEVIYKMV